MNNDNEIDYYSKYLKYKNKYLELHGGYLGTNRPLQYYSKKHLEQIYIELFNTELDKKKKKDIKTIRSEIKQKYNSASELNEALKNVKSINDFTKYAKKQEKEKKDNEKAEKEKRANEEAKKKLKRKYNDILLDIYKISLNDYSNYLERNDVFCYRLTNENIYSLRSQKKYYENYSGEWTIFFPNNLFNDFLSNKNIKIYYELENRKYFLLNYKNDDFKINQNNTITINNSIMNNLEIKKNVVLIFDLSDNYYNNLNYLKLIELFINKKFDEDNYYSNIYRNLQKLSVSVPYYSNKYDTSNIDYIHSNTTNVPSIKSYKPFYMKPSTSYSTKDHDNSLDILFKNKFKIIKMIGDGACLYRSLAFFIKNDQESHYQLRMEMYKFMLDTNDYKKIMLFLKTPEIGPNVDVIQIDYSKYEYDKLKEKYEWGDISQAFIIFMMEKYYNQKDNTPSKYQNIYILTLLDNTIYSINNIEVKKDKQKTDKLKVHDIANLPDGYIDRIIEGLKNKNTIFILHTGVHFDVLQLYDDVVKLPVEDYDIYNQFINRIKDKNITLKKKEKDDKILIDSYTKNEKLKNT